MKRLIYLCSAQHKERIKKKNITPLISTLMKGIYNPCELCNLAKRQSFSHISTPSTDNEIKYSYTYTKLSPDLFVAVASTDSRYRS